VRGDALLLFPTLFLAVVCVCVLLETEYIKDEDGDRLRPPAAAAPPPPPSPPATPPLPHALCALLELRGLEA
jgi:hypothetical protein